MIEPYRPEHIKHMELRTADIIGTYGDNALATNTEAIERLNGPAWTVFANGEPIAVLGIAHIVEGVAHVWALTSVKVEDHKKTFHRDVMEMNNAVMDSFGLHRLQTYVRSDYERSINWLERLGFIKEGLLRKFTHDKVDTWVMTRVKE